MEKKGLSNREARRKKRIQNQIAAYAILIVMIALLGAGAYYGATAVVQTIRNYNEKIEDAIEQAQTAVSEEEEQVPSVQEEASQEEPQTEAVSGENPLDELVEALLQNMTLEEKAAGLFMVSPESITGVGTAIQAGDGTREALAANPVGGILYDQKNYRSDDQFQKMLTNTRAYSKYPLFLAVNRNVGNATTYGLEVTSSASELTDTATVAENYGLLAQGLANLGINMTLSPVADVASGEGNSALKERAFGSDGTTIAPLVNAAVQALQQQEISAVLQKFPGESSAGEEKAITKSLEELRNSEFLAYKDAIANGVDCIMVTNKMATEITQEEIPSCLSSEIMTQILREELGFQGVIVTDYLQDSIVTRDYTSAEAAVAALQAGADMLLEPASYQEAYEGVLRAVSEGILTEERIQESLYRIYRVKYKNALADSQ